MKLTSLVLIVSALTSVAYAEASKCEKIFAESVVLSKKEIATSIHELAALRLDLDYKKASGQTAVSLTALEADYTRKEMALVQNLIGNDRLSREDFIQQYKKEIQLLQGKRDRKNKSEERRKKEAEKVIQVETVTGRKLKFHQVEPGTFQMGRGGPSVTLTRPFEMSATLTTQIVYKAVADLANSKLNGKYNINPSPSQDPGDLKPVNFISYNDVKTWIEALNELSSLGEPGLVKIIPSHKVGDVYRLPSEAEWEFVITSRGTLNQTYFWGNSASQMDMYAWNHSNTGPHQKVQPVATKLPLQWGSVEFYDMLGNVNEFCLDGYEPSFRGGIDPVVPIAEQGMVVIRGGSASSANPSSSYRDYSQVDMWSSSDGFRLVREVKETP